jgi:hypothetical protein
MIDAFATAVQAGGYGYHRNFDLALDASRMRRFQVFSRTAGGRSGRAAN